MWLVLRAMFTRNERGDDVYVIELTRLSVFSVFRTCHIEIVSLIVIVSKINIITIVQSYFNP